LAKNYLKNDGFFMFAGARSVDFQHEWVAEVEDVWFHLRNPTTKWWAELRGWCNSTQFRAIQDMAFHDKHVWFNAWVICDCPTTTSPKLHVTRIGSDIERTSTSDISLQNQVRKHISLL
jgi:hypothetical protein